MEDDKLEEIKNLLSKIIIFDEEYKNNIFDKAAKLDAAGLRKIHEMLYQAESWQKSMIAEKIKSDPKIIEKLENLARQKNKLVLDTKSARFASKDREQMTKILSFIDKL